MLSELGVIASGVASIPAATLVDPCNNLATAPWVVNGSVVVAAGGKNGNGYSFPSGSTNYITYSLAAPAQTDTMTVGCWIKVGTFNAAQNIFEWRSDTAATIHDFMRFGTDGSVNISRSGGSTISPNAPAGTIVVGNWYYVEASVKLHDSTGFALVRVGGTQLAGNTGVDTKNAGTKTVFDAFRINSAGSISTWLVDDIYIRNDANWGP